MTDGAILIAGETRQADARFEAISPSSGEKLEGSYSEATTDDVAKACSAAAEAAEIFGTLSPDERASFLEAVADAIEAIGDELIVTGMAETALPRARLEGERGRTCGQLRLFASEVRDGHWLNIRIDEALPERKPLPRADLRLMNVAYGPVAVFGASNFPLAFSVAGGDTASAFAAGCPVVVKGHPAHPGTGELIAKAISKAVADKGLPGGVFSYLPGTTHELGGALVADPNITAVGFTGSRAGGLALMEIAQKREVPIPVYAEMSAINPVVLMPHAMSEKAAALGTAFIGSLVMGSGQFCTNPGLVVALDSPELDTFEAAAIKALADTQPASMLTAGICKAFAEGTSKLTSHDKVRKLGGSQPAEAPTSADSAIFETSGEAFLADEALSAEVFGAASLIIRCADEAELLKVLSGLEGQLTATLHLTDADETLAAKVLPILKEKAGRVLANGWPTGVEVTHAMVHGGPFPATSAPATTSVGTLAMQRYLRPVCYQDIPDALLPAALKSANPWKLPRRVNGEYQS
ncbi:aldehyde dehydrogenase (NADP(+)) [Altericroceibacterium spongiae]|uniref:Aldehyde dehydrogenase (NADP(+)) n=1 Tax=Altericroceibacterium spongiae TaxID=2320269 RepID=A0A420EAE2_9SPHN|nr:aldehyde dehydrogenase (NADP(+)) [Altericroceibacterium spongiae]RKF17649.1 aldehyde dehydrogenase (NADP(+)) [Altericroceibacterium spongiae]